MAKDESSSRVKDLSGPPCHYCKHLIEAGEQFRPDWWRCTVYPNGVPAAIWNRARPDAHCYESDEFNFGKSYNEKITYQGKLYRADRNT